MTGGDKGEVWGNTQILATRRPRRENPVLINLRDVTFGSDRIRTYRGKTKRSSPADSYQLSTPERVPEETSSRAEETKTAGAEPENPSVPKNLRQIRGRSK